jgi:hypothetical protein
VLESLSADASPLATTGPPSAGLAKQSTTRTLLCRPDARGPLSAADVIQACIDAAPPDSIIEFPPGTYVLSHQVVVAKSLTLRTAGTRDTPLSCRDGADPCAVLMAGANLLNMWGPLVVWSARNVTLEHLVIDGNRAARATSTAAQFCLKGLTSYGFNVAVLDCTSCGVDDIVSKNALCGTGMVWSGTQATIQRSAFIGNGSAAPGMWADGLTAVYAPRSVIRSNTFVDNSDVALIIGYGVGSRLEDNVVLQQTQRMFAGLMLDNFNSDDLRLRGDFRGAVVTNNSVDCGQQLCVFGIQVGPRPWYPTQNIVGGELYDNDVRGATIGINVDGAGVPHAPTTVFANSVQPAPSGSYFTECAQPIPAEWMNVAPTSVVDRRNETERTGSHLSDPCQLRSSKTD